MSEKNIYDNTDDLLRAKFDGAVEKPSDFVWDKIEQNLDKPNRKRRWLLWLLALLPIAILIGLWKFNGSTENGNNNKMSAIENTISDTKNIESKTSNNAIKQNTTINSNNDIVENLRTEKQEKKDNNTLNTTDEKTNTIHFDKQKNDGINANDGIVKQRNSSTIKTLKTNNVAVKNKQRKQINYTTKSTVKKEISSKQIKRNNSIDNFKNVKSYSDIRQLQKDFQPKQIIQTNTNFVTNKVANEIKNGIAKNDPAVADTTKNDSTIIAKNNDTTNTTQNQIAKQSKKKIKEKYISFYISPNASQNSFAASSTAYDFLNEKGKISFTLGARYSFSLSNKILISAGVDYENIKFALGNTPLTFGRFITQPYIFHSSLGDMAVDAATMKAGFNPPSPTFPAQFKINYNYTQSLNFITIPVNIGYKLIDGKIRLELKAGLHSQFLVKQNTTLTLVKESGNNVLNFNSFDLSKTNFAANFALHIAFPSKNKWNFYIEPSAKFMLGSYNKNALVNTKATLLGVGFGVAMKL